MREKKSEAKGEKKIRNAKLDALLPFTEEGHDEFLTSNQGLKINDDQNSLTAGERGPSLLEDFLLREKITHFDHERIPERIVHARGSAAHGFFQVYKPLGEFTKAHFLNDPSAKTPVFVRFSTVAGSRGSSDLARDVRGFAVKFYTQEGNYDLVGNNIPVFFIQDAIKFPDLIHAVKPEPHHEMPQAASAHDTFWDFISLMPESMHMIMWAMSDRAIPRSLRMMEGFGVHTFRWINAKGKSRFVKYHWKPLQGSCSVVWDEAQKISGKDPDFHRRDLWEAIEQGNFPEWELGVQIIEEEKEHDFDFDLLDPTKLVPEEIVPVKRVGKLTLNRNPENFFAETEQVAFHPGHLVPGIDFSNDPLLQGRLFSYTDTQLSRLGSPNFHEIPINRPIAPMHNLQRDGHMRQEINKSRVSYEPNTLGGGCPMQAKAVAGGFISYPEKLSGTKIRGRSEKFFDHFSQATLFWNSQSVPEKNHLISALRFELGKVETVAIRERMVAQLANVDTNLATLVAEGLGISKIPAIRGPLNLSIPADADPKKYQPKQGKKNPGASKALSLSHQLTGGIETRVVAVLVAEGFQEASVAALEKALKAAGANFKIIAPQLGMVKGATGESRNVDQSFLTASSVLFDAVFIPGGKKSIATLATKPEAFDFVNEAYQHSKTIAATREGVEFLLSTAAGGLPTEQERKLARDPGIVADSGEETAKLVKAFIASMAKHRHWEREIRLGKALILDE